MVYSGYNKTCGEQERRKWRMECIRRKWRVEQVQQAGFKRCLLKVKMEDEVLFYIILLKVDVSISPL